MSQRNDNVIVSLTASEAIGKSRRVKLSAGEAAICGAGQEAVGTTVQSVASGGVASVKLDNANGTHECIALGAITVGNALYNAAAGAVSATKSGSRIGIAMATAATTTAVEVLMRGLNS